MWQSFKDYFNFTKKERKGIFILVAIIIVISVLPKFFHLFVKDKPFTSAEFEKEIAELKVDSSSHNFSKKEENFNNYSSSYGQ